MRVISNSEEFMSIRWESLGDQSVKSEVYSRVIVHVKYQTLDIPSHRLNYHGGLLSWDGFGVC